MLELPHTIPEILSEIYRAQRPVIIYGAGIHLAGAEREAREFAFRTKAPVVLTWGAADLMGSVGTFGTHGVRPANFAVQNSDYVICIGSRLDTKATGSPASSFAPRAKLVMVDIDETELQKMEKIGRPLYRSIHLDAKQFLSMINRTAENLKPHEGYIPEWDSYAAWWSRIKGWSEKYTVFPEETADLNPYLIVQKLSKVLTDKDVIVSDTGCSLGWMMQAFNFTGQRFIHAFNQTPMGYGLSAAVGAACATGKRTILITGDGGLAVNIGELATVVRNDLPVKIILFNNRGHAMCRQTQRQWLKAEYPATSYEGGLACPDFRSIADSYGIMAMDCTNWMEFHHGLMLMKDKGSLFLNVEIDPMHGIVGQVKFGHKLEDQEPLLPPEELAEIMKEAA